MRWDWVVVFVLKHKIKISWFPDFFLENIENEELNVKNLHKNMDRLRLQLEKLNKYIYKEVETKTSLEKAFDLTANNFIEELKVGVFFALFFLNLTVFTYLQILRYDEKSAEIETNKMQKRLEEMKKEKERLLRELIETE